MNIFWIITGSIIVILLILAVLWAASGDEYQSRTEIVNSSRSDGEKGVGC